VLERMTEILSLLRDTWSLLFSSMAGGERRRADVVVSLLAVLELCRQGKIRTQQTELFGDIVIERQPEISDTATTERTNPNTVGATTATTESTSPNTITVPTAPAGGV